ncbi:MAG: hypothetical protein ABI688_01875 [Bacteroidota bacterium]
MKRTIFFLLLVTTGTANAQTLKDALYGGKLKTDSGTVIKKGDDLKSKIDTNRKKPVEPEKNKPVIVVPDGVKEKTAVITDTVAAVGKTDPALVTKDNNKIFKEFIDAAVSTLNTEVMSSKKVKKGEYFMMVDYAIEMDGKITINNVYPTPENKFLEEQVKERLSIDTPQLSPVLAGNGKPRKVMKRYNFTLTKN